MPSRPASGQPWNTALFSATAMLRAAWSRASRSTSSAPRSAARSSSRATSNGARTSTSGSTRRRSAVDAVARRRRRRARSGRGSSPSAPSRAGRRSRRAAARPARRRGGCAPPRRGAAQPPSVIGACSRSRWLLTPAPAGCRCRARPTPARGTSTRRVVVVRGLLGRLAVRDDVALLEQDPPRDLAPLRLLAQQELEVHAEVLELLADRVGHDRARGRVRLDRQPLLVPADRLGLLGQRGAEAGEGARLGRQLVGWLVVLVESHGGRCTSARARAHGQVARRARGRGRARSLDLSPLA